MSPLECNPARYSRLYSTSDDPLKLTPRGILWSNPFQSLAVSEEKRWTENHTTTQEGDLPTVSAESNMRYRRCFFAEAKPDFVIAVVIAAQEDHAQHGLCVASPSWIRLASTTFRLKCTPFRRQVPMEVIWFHGISYQVDTYCR